MATRGQVKWFDPKKGYGFIVGPVGQDVFVHYSQIQGDGFRSLKDGETVDYELTDGEKGAQARAVVRLLTPAARTTVDAGQAAV
jgi:cold shock protein